MAARKQEAPLDIPHLERVQADIWIVGSTPLIFNSMSSKALRDLLLGRAKKTAAEKKSVKHHPPEEFRGSLYRFGPKGADKPTELYLPGGAVKGAMVTAALETPGVTSASVKRLIYVEEDKIPVWGIPEALCSVVRSADINKTPDIRTRGILETWCAKVRINFIAPQFSLFSVGALLSNAGVTAGVGDFRVERGRGSFGSFRVATEDDPAIRALLAEAGREQQLAAIADPGLYDEETVAMWTAYEEEISRRTSENASIVGDDDEDDEDDDGAAIAAE